MKQVVTRIVEFLWTRNCIDLHQMSVHDYESLHEQLEELLVEAADDVPCKFGEDYKDVGTARYVLDALRQGPTTEELYRLADIVGITNQARSIPELYDDIRAWANSKFGTRP